MGTDKRMIGRPRDGETERTGVLQTITSLKTGPGRAAAGLFFVEGVNMVREALASGAPVDSLVTSREMGVVPPDILSAVAQKQVPVRDVGRRRYERAASAFAFKQGPQGVGALVGLRWVSPRGLMLPPGSINLALCGVQDAGNVGTILRTCDAVGCGYVFVIGDETADPYGPGAVKTGLGSIFTQRLVKTDNGGLREIVSRSEGSMVGTSPYATQSYKDAPFMRPAVLLVGNEAKGLSDEQMKMCDELVSIPMVGRRDSLNVAVAAAVVLYEMFHKTGK